MAFIARMAIGAFVEVEHRVLAVSKAPLDDDFHAQAFAAMVGPKEQVA